MLVFGSVDSSEVQGANSFGLLNPGTPRPTIYKWLFQLDDSQSLHRKWLFHQTSIFLWLFGVPGLNLLRGVYFVMDNYTLGFHHL